MKFILGLILLGFAAGMPGISQEKTESEPNCSEDEAKELGKIMYKCSPFAHNTGTWAPRPTPSGNQEGQDGGHGGSHEKGKHGKKCEPEDEKCKKTMEEMCECTNTALVVNICSIVSIYQNQFY
ncbi:hypothetical protein CHUAL_005370 [Chamberlinius hualienensis]